MNRFSLFTVLIGLFFYEFDARKALVSNHDLEDDEVWMITKTAFIDFQVDLEPAGRIVIGLFGEAAPNTATNFAALIRGNYGGDSKFGFKGTRMHRLVPDFVLQGGDITNEDGTGGKSIYGETFNDEPMIHSHNASGFVSMANKGKPNTNGSQFFITLNRARWLDGKHIVFGKVLEGMDVIETINDIKADKDGFPNKLIVIEDCGLIKHKAYVLPEDSRY